MGGGGGGGGGGGKERGTEREMGGGGGDKRPCRVHGGQGEGPRYLLDIPGKLLVPHWESVEESRETHGATNLRHKQR